MTKPGPGQPPLPFSNHQKDVQSVAPAYFKDPDPASAWTPNPVASAEYISPYTKELPVTHFVTLSLLLGLFSLLGWGFILGIPAIITGLIGRRRAKRINQSPAGATAGIVLGTIGTVISFCLLAYLFKL